MNQTSNGIGGNRSDTGSGGGKIETPIEILLFLLTVILIFAAIYFILWIIRRYVRKKAAKDPKKNGKDILDSKIGGGDFVEKDDDSPKNPSDRHILERSDSG
eukprot:TRINITY_DN4873_c0_g1_i3.p2 TRINITY_DN4873_c0_g1~~TRINITY_DN4873_c0_g1_i3.p2  ORF type:complete len:102 (+),score=14.23 TRINITY_DN4873_c0_g1_i3:87-392(+)